MSKYFQAMGLDVRHEAHGIDGISSWYVVDEYRKRLVENFYGSKRRPIKAIHVVRNPLKVMESMRRCEAIQSRAALNIFRRMFPEFVHMEVNEIIAHWWVAWNKLARVRWDFCYTLQIEEAKREEVLDDLCCLTETRADKKVFKAILAIPENTHTIEPYFNREIRKNNPEAMKPFTMDDVPEEAREDVAALACFFGYSPEDLDLARGDLSCGLSVAHG